MRLFFIRRHKSIKGLPGIILPDFVLLTGQNGAGKSHLLEAIENGNIAVDGIGTSEIRRLDRTSIIPADEARLDQRSPRKERAELWTNFQNQKNRPSLTLHNARNNGISVEGLTKAEELVALSVEQLATRLPAPATNAPKLKRNIDQWFQDELSQYRSQVGNFEQIEKLAASLGKSDFRDLTESDFMEAGAVLSQPTDPFKVSIARVFSIYRDELLQNDLRGVQARRGVGGPTHLTPEEFVARHKEPPWETFNRTLDLLQLPFEVNAPSLLSYEDYQPVLTKKSSGDAVAFSALSSGEQILISLALSRYYVEDGRQPVKIPKLLLLDELDGPLHPSMTRQYLAVIRETLIQGQGLKVIATTHSPSTVALADDASIFIMSPIYGLSQSTRPQALNMLTEGVPTLSLSYDGRRQVFVESPTDAEVFAKLMSVCRPLLKSERSLEFISTGAKDSKTKEERNTGVDAVCRIVRALVAAGNTSSFGLIDWDNGRCAETRIDVLSANLRNGLENAIYDPLVLVYLIVRDLPLELAALGLKSSTTTNGLDEMDDKALQALVDRLQDHILGPRSTQCIEDVVRYLGGRKLSIRREYLRTDDHELGNLISKKLPNIHKIQSKNAGATLLYIVDRLLQEKPHIISQDLLDTLAHLLNAPAHTASERSGPA